MVGFCENSVPGLQMAPPTHPLCLAWSFLGVKRKPERDREPLVSLLVRTVVLSGQGSIGKPLLLLFSGSVGRESICNVGDPGSIPGSGRSARQGIGYPLQYSWAFLVAQLVKNPPAMRETWIRSLGWEDPLEKGKAIHSSILAWRILWTVQSMGSQRVG